MFLEQLDKQIVKFYSRLGIKKILSKNKKNRKHPDSHSDAMDGQDRNIMNYAESSMQSSFMTIGNYTAVRRPMGNLSLRFPLTNSDPNDIGLYQRPSHRHPNRHERFISIFADKLKLMLEILHSENQQQIETLLNQLDYPQDFSASDIIQYRQRITELDEVFAAMLTPPQKIENHDRSEQKTLAHLLRVMSRIVGVKTVRYLVNELAVDSLFDFQHISPAGNEEHALEMFTECPLDYDLLHNRRLYIVQSIHHKCLENHDTHVETPIKITAPVEGYPCLILEMHDHFKMIIKTMEKVGQFNSKGRKKVENAAITPLHLPGEEIRAVTAFLSAYLAGLVNFQCRKLMGSDWIWTDFQPSFGSLRPTFTDTGYSIRFSAGMIPEDYHEAFKNAIEQLQFELSKESSSLIIEQIFRVFYSNPPGKKSSKQLENAKSFKRINSNAKHFQIFLEYVVLKASCENECNLENIMNGIIEFETLNIHGNQYASATRPGLIQALLTEPDSDIKGPMPLDIAYPWLSQIKFLLNRQLEIHKAYEICDIPQEIRLLISRLFSMSETFLKTEMDPSGWNESIFFIEQGMNILTLAYELSETLYKLFDKNGNCIDYTQDDEASNYSENSIVTQESLDSVDDEASRKYYAFSTLNGMESYDIALKVLMEFSAMMELAPLVTQPAEVYFEYFFKNINALKKPVFQLLDSIENSDKKVSHPVDVLIGDLSPFPQSVPGDEQQNFIKLAEQSSPVIAIIDITSASTESVDKMTKQLFDNIPRLQEIILVASDNKYAQAGIDSRSRGEIRLASTKRKQLENEVVTLAGKALPYDSFKKTFKTIFKEFKSYHSNLNQARDRMYQELGLRRTFKPKDDHGQDILEERDVQAENSLNQSYSDEPDNNPDDYTEEDSMDFDERSIDEDEILIANNDAGISQYFGSFFRVVATPVSQKKAVDIVSSIQELGLMEDTMDKIEFTKIDNIEMK